MMTPRHPYLLLPHDGLLHIPATASTPGHELALYTGCGLPVCSGMLFIEVAGERPHDAECRDCLERIAAGARTWAAVMRQRQDRQRARKGWEK